MKTKHILAIALILGLLFVTMMVITAPSVSAASAGTITSCYGHETTGPFDPAGIYDENHDRCWHY